MRRHNDYCLFLDDIRDVMDVPKLDPKNNWVVARNARQFVDTVLERGLPTEVSFDYDLEFGHYGAPDREDSGDLGPDGADCALWLRNYCMSLNLPLPNINIHSSNPRGVKRIFAVFL